MITLEQAPRWLDWVRRLQAVAQSGLTYAQSPFDVERYQAVRQVAAEMAAAEAGVGAEELAAAFADEVGHATPKVDVRAAVVRDGEVLLVRNLDSGAWSLPGGWAEIGESPSAAAAKELREEAGVDGRPVKLVGVYERDVRGRARFPFYGYRLVFLCEPLGLVEATHHAVEVDDSRWFAEGELPELDGRTSLEQLAHVFAHTHAPELETHFD